MATKHVYRITLWTAYSQFYHRRRAHTRKIYYHRTAHSCVIAYMYLTIYLPDITQSKVAINNNNSSVRYSPKEQISVCQRFYKYWIRLRWTVSQFTLIPRLVSIHKHQFSRLNPDLHNYTSFLVIVQKYRHMTLYHHIKMIAA